MKKYFITRNKNNSDQDFYRFFIISPSYKNKNTKRINQDIEVSYELLLQEKNRK